MKKLFDPDSPILRFLTQAAELAWLNILWVVCIAAGFHSRRFDRGALHGGAEHDPRLGALEQRGLFPRVSR